MASNTKKTELIRLRRHRNAGKDRRRRLRSRGSTPQFPIHVEPREVEQSSQTS